MKCLERNLSLERSASVLVFRAWLLIDWPAAKNFSPKRARNSFFLCATEYCEENSLENFICVNLGNWCVLGEQGSEPSD